MKKYGIYLLYPPTVDLRKEGLGRHLAYFLKASLERQDVKFVIACTTWMPVALKQLLYDYDIDPSKFEIIVLKRVPFVMRLYYLLHIIYRIFRRIKIIFVKFYSKILSKKLTLTILIVITIGLNIMGYLIKISYDFLKKYLKKLLSQSKFKLKSLRLTSKSLNNPDAQTNFLKKLPFVNKAFYKCQYAEGLKLSGIINNRKDIAAWYCPTLFWPSFNEISRPKLICVPDVVISSFPIGFALSDSKLGNVLLNINKTISNGEFFVTYSQDVKINTLVKNYHLNPDKISVIPHGTNRLDDFINIKHEHAEEATEMFCRNVFALSLYSSVLSSQEQIALMNTENIKFIFYASQGRPHKNILLLLRVYEYLLRKKYISYKLILTANPYSIQAFADFTITHNLTNDVLWLHGLSSRQLAACYKLADLAVNPSLSEGGFPFTFTEALSVDTPVVMARINVTEEIITDSEMQKTMLFDPYDFQDMADKIEWALKNKETLLALQKPLYEKLAQRTWKEVVNDYIEVLDSISSGEEVNDQYKTV